MPSAADRLLPQPGRLRRGTRRPATPRAAQGKGATRRSASSVKEPRKPSVWWGRLLILTAVAIVGGVATRAYIALESLPVQRISVTGELEHTQAEAVQDMVQASLSGGFVNADLQRMRSQLESLPWIYQATVRRRWPSALEIHVVEQLPIARWGERGFLNHEGLVFHSDKAGDWDSLPLLSGPEGAAPALMARYLRLVELLAPLNLSVAQLSVDERGQIEAQLAGGLRLVIGSDDFFERMQRFAMIYRSQLATRVQEIERVDLRYATGVAVAFRDSSQVAGL
ncbi:MAG: FtsQ-type POTRA domain-containing protein [Halioglobus sp.]